MSIEEQCVDDWVNKVSKGGTDACMVSLSVAFVKQHRNDVCVKVKARVALRYKVNADWLSMKFGGNWMFRHPIMIVRPALEASSLVYRRYSLNVWVSANRMCW